MLKVGLSLVRVFMFFFVVSCIWWNSLLCIRMWKVWMLFVSCLGVGGMIGLLGVCGLK